MSFFYTGAFMHHNCSKKVPDGHPLRLFHERRAELDKIFHVYYKDGKRFLDEVEYEPYLFVKNGDPYAEPTSDFTTLRGEGLDKVTFDCYGDMRDKAIYNKIDNQLYYGSTNSNFVFLNDTYRGDVPYETDTIKSCSTSIFDPQILYFLLRSSFVFAWQAWRLAGGPPRATLSSERVNIPLPLPLPNF